MEQTKILLNDENEEILRRLDNTIGLKKSKETLRNIIRCHEIMQKYQCNLEFENYNIIIRNESDYNTYEELISVIAEIYYKNGIIPNSDIMYLSNEEFDKRTEKNNKKNTKKDNEKIIKEGIIIINLLDSRRTPNDLKKTVEKMITDMPDKAFIILEDDFFEGSVNSLFVDSFSWSIKVEKISNEEKEEYVKKFLKENSLICSEEKIKEIARKPYYKVKNELINVLVECKINETNNVNNVKKTEQQEQDQKTGLEELKELEGLENVKKQVEQIVNYVRINKKRGKMPVLHMCFRGNPGTGKTTVARIIDKIFCELGILSEKEKFVEAQRSDLVGEYVGHTAMKTKRLVQSAKGGVLFIDEAYNLNPRGSDKDYGYEAIATLIKEMEDNRDNLCVILAGYTNEMNQMLKVNPGFESRIQFYVDFPDYNEEALYQIFKNMAKSEKYKLTSTIKSVLIEEIRKEKNKDNFANARAVRNIFEKVKFEQADRVAKSKKEDINLIKKVDVQNVIDKIGTKEVLKNKIGFAV